MSQRAKDVIKKFVIKYGDKGKARLCRAVGRSLKTIDRWIETGRIPDSHLAYLFFKEIGVGEDEALALASEASAEAKAG